jgi:lipid A 3-O-deacylase
MKRVLGVAASISILITASVQSGLVADDNPSLKGPAPAPDTPPAATNNLTKIDAAPAPAAAEKTAKPAPEAITAPKPVSTPRASGRSQHGISFMLGNGNGTVETIAVAYEFYPDTIWLETKNAVLIPYVELLAAYWESEEGHTGVTSLHEGGLSGYVRYIRQGGEGTIWRPYIDFGIGLHYMTEDRIEGKELGKQWLAGSNIGAGIVMGKAQRFDLGIRYRHLSNAGTEEINWGINHSMIRAALRF